MPHTFSFDGFDHFTNSSSSNHPQDDDNLFSEPQVFSTFRFIVYRSILMEYIWYEGDDIPENPHVKFPILLNPKWANDLNFKDFGLVLGSHPFPGPLSISPVQKTRVGLANQD